MNNTHFSHKRDFVNCYFLILTVSNQPKIYICLFIADIFIICLSMTNDHRNSARFMLRYTSIFLHLIFTGPAHICLHETVIAEPSHIVPGTS